MLMAKRAAIVDNYRIIGGTISQIEISGPTGQTYTVKDLMSSNDEIRSKVSTHIQSSQIVAEAAQTDCYSVTMQNILNGDNGLNSIIGQTIIQKCQ